TSLLFVALGFTADVYQPMVLCVGGMVAIAAANAGATSQDLKTGFLVGATPRAQQIGLLIGVVAASLVIGFTIQVLDKPSVDAGAAGHGTEDIGPGSLFATGLVAGGTITGTIVAFLHWPDVPGQPSWLDPADWSAGLTGLLGAGGYQILGVALFAVMGIVLYRVARRSFSL